MDKCLLDTDILSEITKGVNVNVMAKAIAYRTAFGRYTLSVFSVVETIKGYHRVRRPDRIAQFRSSLIGEEILTLSTKRTSRSISLGDTHRRGMTARLFPVPERVFGDQVRVMTALRLDRWLGWNAVIDEPELGLEPVPNSR